jgi:hypothetical protein
MMKVTAILIFTLLLSSCFVSTQEFHSTVDTVGHRLVDLEQAKKCGAITEAEFQSIKAKELKAYQ